MQKILDWLRSPAFFLSVLLIVIALLVVILLRRFTRRRAVKEAGKGERLTVTTVISRVMQMFVLAVGIILILEVNGVNVTGAVAGLGIAGAVVGLALQDLLKDIIMGIHILAGHFYSVGDCVEYMGREGIILSFTVITTKIGDLDDHSIVTLCNRNVTEIRRFGKRLDIDVPLSYEENVARIHTVMGEIAAAVAEADGVEGCEYKGTQAFKESAVLYKLRLHCSPDARADVRRTALTVIQKELDARGIHIPYNQIDVHIDPRK